MNSKQLLAWAQSKKWDNVKKSLDTINTSDFSSFEIIQCFLHAVFGMQYDIVKWFIDAGMDVNVICSRSQQFALSLAALKVDDQMIRLLIKNGANVNLYSEASFPALYTLLVRAEKFCFGSTYPELADPPIVDVRLVFMDSITIFLDNNVNLNLKTDTSDETALDFASILRWSELVKIFLDHGATVNECRDGGYDALMNVRRLNDIESFELLFGHHTISSETRTKVYAGVLELEKVYADLPELKKHNFIGCIKKYCNNYKINDKSSSTSIVPTSDDNNTSLINPFLTDFYGHYKISTEATAEMYIQKGINIFHQNFKPETIREDEIRTFWQSRSNELAAIELIIESNRIILQNDSDTEDFQASFFNSDDGIHITINWFGNVTEFIIKNIDDGLIYFEHLQQKEHELSEAVWKKI
jgi:hypothetical protein